ncbi:MAG: Hsp33 family molecular chaperone HslO [Planctomycetes bacterium]|nr:Hsp33 family molecular chaperone HslO [Planctomycetota bacterium]
MTIAGEIPGEALIERRLCREHELVLARGDFAALFEAHRNHVATWGLTLDPLGEVMMRQALAGAALHLSSRPRDETAAFTFNFVRPAANVFVAGNSRDGAITGRIFVEDVATAAAGRLFVQTRRAGGRDFSSVIDTEGLDLLLILEDYCARSEQSPARFFELGGDDYLMVVSLPVEDRGGLEGLDRDRARELFERSRPLDDKRFRFLCGCDPQRMRQVIQGVFAGRLDELFGDEAAVQVSCPRCGRGWSLRRDQIEPETER